VAAPAGPLRLGAKANDSPIPVEVRLWLFFQSRAETISSAMMENEISMPIFHSDGESAKMPKAAPGFSAWMIRKNPGMTGMLSCKESRRAIVHLVTRSSATTDNAIRK